MDHLAIRKAYPQVVTIDDKEGAFDIDGNKVEIVQSEVDAASAELSRLDYQWQRANEYPPVAQQLDTIFHQGIDAWKSEIQVIKDRYPKP